MLARSLTVVYMLELLGSIPQGGSWTISTLSQIKATQNPKSTLKSHSFLPFHSILLFFCIRPAKKTVLVGEADLSVSIANMAASLRLH